MYTQYCLYYTRNTRTYHFLKEAEKQQTEQHLIRSEGTVSKKAKQSEAQLLMVADLFGLKVKRFFSKKRNADQLTLL